MQENLHVLTFSLLATIIVFFPGFSRCNIDESYLYSLCSSNFTCGKSLNVGFPFWGNSRPGYCGHEGLELRCENDETTTIEIKSIKYRVIDLSIRSRIMTISRLDFGENVCPDEYSNTTLDTSLFSYTSGDIIATLFYDCSHSFSSFLNEFTCTTNNGTNRVGYLNITNVELGKDLELSCDTSVIVPILKETIQDLIHRKLSVNQVIDKGFEVNYWIGYDDENWCHDCVRAGGACGYNSTDVFSCFNRATPAPSNVEAKTGRKGHYNLGLRLGIGFGAAGGSIVLMLVIFCIYQRRNKKKFVATSYVSRNMSSDYSSMDDIEKMGSAFGLNIFTYSELVEATNNFDASKELGDGGFGTVYYGKLKDGRTVAVKRLYENNIKRVEQFLNEVGILTRLRHKNLVLLYGCTSRHSQELLLVYEYIPNGTVADHLHGDKVKPGCSLPWAMRLKIAIETASALAYLHASDVIHRDVKSNNILLDNNFCVKVADFGLSRLFPTDVTHVSTAPQGTPGYVDPDYHQCYQLTDKSDVYSFGVVMIELISSKPAVDITRHRHEINLSNMAINKIQNGQVHELVDLSLGYESDRNIHKMMNAVAELAFRCLQSDKDLRPTMEEVLNTLTDILSDAQNAVKPKDVHVLADEDVLLKNGNLALSPDSVTVKWASTYTTPNTSG